MKEKNGHPGGDNTGDGQEASAPAPPEAAEQKLQELQQTVEQVRDQLLRKAAEFENYKRRTESDIANVIRSANESLVAALLPVLDDFDRSLRAGAGGADAEAFYRGIELIQAKLLKVLEGRGLSSFESVGKPFDVEFHDALLQVPRTDVPPHTVVEEVEKGYRFNDRVLRHARVVVSAAPGGDEADEPAEPQTDA